MRDNLAIQKGAALLFALLFGLSSLLELLWPGSIQITVDETVVEPQSGLSYYGTLGAELLLGVAALALFWWLHRRVRRVIASELGLQIMGEPVAAVAWSEVYSVKKTLPNFLSGFYLIKLTKGTEFYAPIEREPPQFSTLGTWFEAPTLLEQLCSKNGVWTK